MRNMNLMLTKTPPEDIKQHILPVVYNALDAESSQVQVCRIWGEKKNFHGFFLGTLFINNTIICTFN